MFCDIDPRDVPEKLQCLTQIKEIPLALANPLICVYRPKRRHRGCGGHVVKVTQDVAISAPSLLQLGAGIPVIIGRRAGVEKGMHKDFISRKVKLRATA